MAACGGGSSSSSSGGSGSGSGSSAIRIASIFGENMCVTERHTEKAIPKPILGLPESVWVEGFVNIPNWGVPESVWGSFQFGDQHIHSKSCI